MNIAEIAQRTIPQDTAHKTIFVKDGETEDIIHAIKESIPESVRQTREFAAALKREYGTRTKELLNDLYAYVIQNIRLKIDPAGRQDIRRPANLVHGDGTADCKSYSLFFAGVLTNLGIPFRFKFVSWQDWDKNVKHVYIEAKANGETIYLDANKKRFNSEQKPFYNVRYLTSSNYIGANLPHEKFSDFFEEFYNKSQREQADLFTVFTDAKKSVSSGTANTTIEGAVKTLLRKDLKECYHIALSYRRNKGDVAKHWKEIQRKNETEFCWFFLWTLGAFVSEYCEYIEIEDQYFSPYEILVKRKYNGRSITLFAAALLHRLGCNVWFYIGENAKKPNNYQIYLRAGANREWYFNGYIYDSPQEDFNTINTIEINMTRISYIGETKQTGKGLLNGRSLEDMGTAEINLRAKRNKLRAERDKIASCAGIGDTRQAINTYNAAINYTDDLINAVGYIARNNVNDQTAAAILGPIIEDWENGDYMKHSRHELNERRKTQKHEIGKNFFKKLGSTLKSFCKKTLKGTKNLLAGSVKMLGNVTRLATVAPFAVLTKKGRKNITNIAQSIASNAKQFASGFADVNRALPSAICETALDKRLPAAAWTFVYLCISDDEKNAGKWVMRSDCEGYKKGEFVNIPAKVLEKRKKAAAIKKKFTKYLGVDDSAFDKIISAAILDQTGFTQEKCVDLILSGNGGIISIAKEVAASASLLKMSDTQIQHEQNLVKLIQECETSIEKVANAAAFDPDQFTDSGTRKLIYESQATSIYFNYLRQLYAVMLQLLYTNYEEFKKQIVTGQTNPDTMTDYNAFIYWLNKQWKDVMGIIPYMAKFDANCLNLYEKNYPLYAERYEKHLANLQNYTLDISAENNDADLSNIDTEEVGEAIAALITAIVSAICAIVGTILKCCGKDDAASVCADCSNVGAALASSDDGAVNKITAATTALSNSSNQKVAAAANTAQTLTTAVQQANNKAAEIKEELYDSSTSVTTYLTNAAETLEKADTVKTVNSVKDTLQKVVDTITPTGETENTASQEENATGKQTINKWWLILGGVGVATALLVSKKSKKKKH